MTTIQAYVEAKVADPKARRRITADFARAGINVQADSVENFKNHIDSILSKMNLKRAPLEGRVPTPYTPALGSHDRNVIDGVDPIDGKKLEKIFLAGDRAAMYNPFTGVVWPLPVSKTSPAQPV